MYTKFIIGLAAFLAATAFVLGVLAQPAWAARKPAIHRRWRGILGVLATALRLLALWALLAGAVTFAASMQWGVTGLVVVLGLSALAAVAIMVAVGMLRIGAAMQNFEP